MRNKIIAGLACVAITCSGPTVASASAGISSAAAPVVRLSLDGEHLTVRDAFAVLEADTVQVKLDPEAVTAMKRTRRGALAALKGGARVYGWNQALGPLKDHPLDATQQRRFQRNMLLSHAAGTGPALPDRVARLALIIKANQMARADEGVRPEVPQRLLDLVNAGITPVMPQIGSLGTGDLQPQAAAGLVAIGEQAPARYRGEERPAAQILPMAGLSTDFEFQQGEALPLISGSTVAAAQFLDAVHQAESLADLAEGAFALFMEATRAEQSSLDRRTHDERHIPEQKAVAARIRTLIKGSQWMTDRGRAQLDTALGQEPHPRIQDAVSVRAAPHILAVLRRDLAHCRTILRREINSSTSNPLIFPKAGGGYEFVMGGNWDAAMMGHAADTLNADVADVAVLSQELSGRLLSSRWSYGLPANLAGGVVGLNSGLVQVQTVAAALIPEMQSNAFPASVLSRPVKDGQEDHNSMAMASIRKTLANLGQLPTVLAVQYLMAAQGIDLIKDKMTGLSLGAGTNALHQAIRKRVPALVDDRWMSPDLQAVTNAVTNGELLATVRAATKG
ncbi:HAL/PAL/TAL family ammonia-lyase [Herbidospora daliensis]|uniref:HAL/PAL/TAL family ammonia-lyase n=1 Tax=Herbidospora daliensis TaxID=295585 RepID=UPI000780D59A|nr:aromatic amino acid ammonia-lyase [Herbidospora daliensis]